MNRVLIIGSKGMAGHVIRKYLLEDPQFEVHDISRSDAYFPSTYQLDISDFNELAKILEGGNYKVVINCVGLLNQQAESRPDLAIQLNSYLPHFLAQKGTENGYRLIHISTDCVFSGKKGGYKITDLKDGVGYYARTKALGEVDYNSHLTIRTSIIGPELKTDGIGLFDWFMKQDGTINGFDKAYWSGVTTQVLAMSVKEAIDQDLQGLYQLTNNSKVSKNELLRIFKQVFDRSQVEIQAVEGKHVDKSLINERSDFDFDVPDYREMIEMMKSYISLNINSYPDYYQH